MDTKTISPNEEDKLPTAAASPEAVAVNMPADLLTIITSMDGIDGASLEEKVRHASAQQGVVIFSKSHCPFCLEVKRTFTDLGVPATVLEMDKMSNGGAVHAAVKKQTSHATVPNVFINGTHVGGCDDVKRLQASGELRQMLRSQTRTRRTEGGDDGDLHSLRFTRPPRGTAIKSPGLAPDAVNFHAVRMTAFFVVVLCCLSIAFREDAWGQWLAVFLLVDFSSRVLVGGGASILATLSVLLTVPLEPDFRAGPPQQFAALCGVVFSATAVGCYFGDELTAGAVVLGLLIGAAALQAFLGICVGCIFFGLGIRFGLVPKSIHRVFTDTRPEIVASYKYMTGNSKAAAPTRVSSDPAHRGEPSYKAGRSEEWSKDDFHLIRHAHVSYFAVPLSFAGLAVAWKLASHWLDGWAASLPSPLGDAAMQSLQAPIAWSHVFAIAGGALFAIVFVLYLLRLALYPHKVWMDWTSPSRHAGFGMITLTVLLFSFLAVDAEVDGSGKLARALWWIGAVPHMLLTVAKFGEIVGKRGHEEHLQPSWLVLPVGNLAAALVAPVAHPLAPADLGAAVVAAFGPDAGSLELASFFFGFGLLMWLVLLTLTFWRAATSHNSDDRARIMLYVWVAAPCVAGLADLVIRASRGNEGASLALVTDFSRLYFVGIIFALGLGWGWLPYVGFLGRFKFDMSYWALAFPLDTLAAAAAVYFALSGFEVAEALAVITLALATGANLLALLHTCVALARRRNIFVPEKRWGPTAFMFLTHEALREAVPALLQDLASADVADKESLRVVAAHMVQFEIIHEEHSRHEDNVMFKFVADCFPGHTTRFDGDHGSHRGDLERFLRDAQMLLNAANANTATGERSQPQAEEEGQQEQLEKKSMDEDGVSEVEGPAEALARLQREVPAFMEHMLEHLRGEEAHVMPVARRYMPVALQRELTRRCFDMTPADRWETIVPYMINHLPRHPQRVTYLKAFMWAMPERAQQIGAIVYRNTDAVMWERLAAELPEMIPRGVKGWWRFD